MKTGVLSAGEGQTVWVVGDRYTIKASGKETAGAFSLIEAIVPPQAGPPPHLHHREDEAFYVLEGAVEFHADGRSFTARPGDWITLARGSLHRFQNIGTTPARMLMLVTPSGLEDYFLEVGREARDGESGPMVPSSEDIEKLVATAPKYGLEIKLPESS